MMGKNRSNDGLITIFLKLAPLFISVVIGDLIILTGISLLFKLCMCYALMLCLSPIICFILFYLLNQPEIKRLSKEGAGAPNFKFYPRFPFYYSFPFPKKNNKINVDDLPELQNCDIILRRYDHLLDGLIFSQNSYFTHAGLFYLKEQFSVKEGNSSTWKKMVLHVTMEADVHEITLEEYCKCDDIAILRFGLEDTLEDLKVAQYIEDETSDLELKAKELVLHSFLDAATRLNIDADKKNNPFGNWQKIVLSRALSLIGTPYDHLFEFSNFERVSCIEYVWYCYKCLFPFHRIRVKDFEFFNWIKMPVIVPDVFIKNDFFKHVWSSIPAVMKLPDEFRKSTLKNFIKEQKDSFRTFIWAFYIWTTGILFLIILLIRFLRS